VTVPSGLSAEEMPLGLQLIGKPYGELNLLQVAAWCEEALGFPKEPRDPYTP
jgi:Asp-tRNA(Asn)/Glu-tRNA(Gln) amidotransferase A subunit family amidase